MQKRLLGVLVCIAVIAPSCQSPEVNPATSSASEPTTSAAASTALDPHLAAEQILRIYIGGDPESLDPTPGGGGDVLHALHRGLVSFDQDLNVVPELAESWDISDDARTFTFHLRDARYSNGEPIVAGDLVYSWKRLADPRTAAAYQYAIAEVEGGPELLAMTGIDPAPSDAAIDTALDNFGVTAPDDKTFIVHLHQPATYFLSAMTLWFLVPVQKEWVADRRGTEASGYVSSGPFVLDTWDHNNQIVLKPNPYWWGDIKPTLTEIQMSMLSDVAGAQAAYEAGEIDMVRTPPAEVQRIRNDPVLGAEYREVSRLGIHYYQFNNFQDPNLSSFANPGPTVNKDFRIALTQAIDKQTLIDLTEGGLGQVANSFIMPGIPGHQPDLNPYPYDLDSAKQRMDKALTELAVSSVAELGKLKIGFASGFGREQQVAFLAEAWRQAFGLETEQLVSDLSVFSAERGLGYYDISFTGWGADYPHANNQLSGTFSCRGGNNQAQYCNPAFDALIAKAAAEPDVNRQLAIYNEAQTMLIEDAPFLPLRYLMLPYEVKPYVSDLVVSSADSWLPGDSHYETIRILEH